MTIYNYCPGILCNFWIHFQLHFYPHQCNRPEVIFSAFPSAQYKSQHDFINRSVNFATKYATTTFTPINPNVQSMSSFLVPKQSAPLCKISVIPSVVFVEISSKYQTAMRQFKQSTMISKYLHFPSFFFIWVSLNELIATESIKWMEQSIKCFWAKNFSIFIWCGFNSVLNLSTSHFEGGFFKLNYSHQWWWCTKSVCKAI